MEPLCRFTIWIPRDVEKIEGKEDNKRERLEGKTGRKKGKERGRVVFLVSGCMFCIIMLHISLKV
jgi:hypothetical protein